MRKLAAETIGTFALVFSGTGAIVIDDVSGGGVSHVGVALTFGLVVMAMIYAIGDISGAHINPAVTIGFWIARRFEGARVLPYVPSQLAGAIAASLLLRVLFPSHAGLGGTLPAGPADREPERSRRAAAYDWSRPAGAFASVVDFSHSTTRSLISSRTRRNSARVSSGVPSKLAGSSNGQ